MTKLPVWETIRFAYAFTFGQIGIIIGLIWIPAVINAVGGFIVTRGYDAQAEQLAAAGSVGVPPGIGFLLLFMIAAVLLAAMIIVSITQQALGLRQGPAFAHLALGSAELRIFGAIFGLYLLFFLFAVGVMLVTLVVGTAVQFAAPAIPGLQAVTALVGLAGFCALFYAMVRLSFLFVPSAVA